MLLISAKLKYQQDICLNTQQIQLTGLTCLRSSTFWLNICPVSDLERMDTSINLGAVTSQQALSKQGDESQLRN